jgi:predicted acylesterase/phospholipase RssA
VATEVSLFSFLTRGARPKPFYIALDQEFGTDTAMGVLLQSAAIPEIFGGKPLPGAGVVVDGGVADNTPLLGVFKEKPDVVIVIYLDHRFGRVTAQRLKEKEILRIREIADLKKHDQERDVKGEVDAWCASLEFIPVIPSQSLGNFLTGTLDFSSAGALSRIEMGYRDTLLQIRRLIAS